MTIEAIRSIQVGGTLDPGENVYIVRAADDEVFQLLLAGQYCNVLTSRQMGKSSLMVSVSQRLQAGGIRVASIDLAGEIGKSLKQEDAYIGLLDILADRLDLSVDAGAWWEQAPRGTHNQKLLRFFREVVGASATPTVIFLDEIDATLKLDFSDDLFVAIRTMHNERPIEPGYGNITFCLLGVVTPNELIKDQRTTAYNIGSLIELRDFDADRDDLSPLVAALDQKGLPGAVVLPRVLYWTGGHPYLTLRVCNDLIQQRTTDVDDYVRQSYKTVAHLSADPHFAQVLRFVHQRLDEKADTLRLYERILRGHREADSPTLRHAQLKLSGLVKRDEIGNLIVRNRIYGHLFDRRWTRSIVPQQVKRLRRITLAAVAALLITLAAIAYRELVTKPAVLADAQFGRLQTALTWQTASSAYDVLLGRVPNSELLFHQRLRGYQKDATREFGNFQERWRLRMENASRKHLQDQDDDGFLILAACLAVRTHRPVSPEALSRYEALSYPYLEVTMRGPLFLGSGLAVSTSRMFVAMGNTVWNVEDGFPDHSTTQPAVNAVAFDDANRLFAGDDAGKVKVWKGTELLATMSWPSGSAITSIAVSHDGASVAAIFDEGSVYLRQANGEPRRLPQVAAPVSLAFDRNERTLIIGDATGSVWLWPLTADARPVAMSHESVTSLAVDPTGRGFAAAAGKAVVLVPEDHRSKTSIQQFTANVSAVAYSPDGTEIAVVTPRDGLRRFDRKGVPRTQTATQDQIAAEDRTLSGVAYVSKGHILTKSASWARVWSIDQIAASDDNSPPETIYARWQKQLGLTVDDHDEVVAFLNLPRARTRSRATAPSK